MYIHIFIYTHTYILYISCRVKNLAGSPAAAASLLSARTIWYILCLLVCNRKTNGGKQIRKLDTVSLCVCVVCVFVVVKEGLGVCG